MLQRIAELTCVCAIMLASSHGAVAQDQPDKDEALANLLQSNIELRSNVKTLTESVDAVSAEMKLLRKMMDRTVAPALAAAQAPTPHSEVARILELLAPKENETLVDYGCGDGRFLIAAVETYGCKAVGVEIDPEKVALARAKIENAGLQDRIQIIEGDALTADVKADIGVVYLYPELLAELAPKLKSLKRLASYQHVVPGLAMTKERDAYTWGVQSSSPAVVKSAPVQQPVVNQVQQVATTQPTRRLATWNGRQYAGPNGNCACAMCQSIRQQLGMLSPCTGGACNRRFTFRND